MMSNPPTLQQGPENQSFIERHNIHPLVFAAACLVAVFILYHLLGGSITFLVAGTTQVTRGNVALVRLLTMGGQIVCILLPTILLARLLEPQLTRVFRWRLPSLLETLYASLGLLFFQQMIKIYLFFQDRIPVPEILRKSLEPMRHTMEELFKNLVAAESIPELLLVILVVAVVPAIIEEMFFRGLIQATLEKVVPSLWAAMLTGAIFGLYHFNPFAIVPLVGLGCYFGFLRWRSGSIALAMTAHFLNNAVAVLESFFRMDEEVIIGADKSVESNVVIVITQFFLYLLLFLACFSSYVRITGSVQGKTNGR